MNNSMAKAMTERYVEYLNTGKLEERAAKSIYYWVMNTIESIFWVLILTLKYTKTAQNYQDKKTNNIKIVILK